MISIDNIKNRNFNLGIVGMGRIGLPLAVSFAMEGVRVFGTEKREEILQLLNNTRTPFLEDGLQEALEISIKSGKLSFTSDNKSVIEACPIIIIAVGTPLRENLLPDMSLIDHVITEICGKAKNDTILILRSTLVPGTTEKQILPKIKELNNSLRVAVCPERIMEGNAMKELKELPEIIGVEDLQVGKIIRELFLLLGPKEIELTDTKTAEAAKIFANVYRYVTFALANEFAIISEDMSINAREAIRLANKGYPRSRIPLPGPAAGPCLRKDGHFLARASFLNLIKTSWILNESLPVHILNTIEQKYGNVYGKQIGVLGKSYKANVDDLRDSLALVLIDEAKSRGANVVSYDPYTNNSSTLEEVLGSEIVILAVNHSYFNNITTDMLKKTKLVYDAWGQFSKLDLKSQEIKYLVLGVGI